MLGIMIYDREIRQKISLALNSHEIIINIKANNYDLIEVKSYDFTKNIRAFYGFDQKYKNQNNNITKMVITKSHFEIRDELFFLPAYLF